MSVLGTITRGTAKVGSRIVISGVEKMGKTTLACGAPKPLLIPMEQGYGAISIDKTALIQSYEDLTALLDEITYYAKAGTFPYASLVFDSATALERILHDYTLRSDRTYKAKNKDALTMESAHGGYGKAYQYANELFGRFLTQCDQLATYGGINIVITCHVFPSTIKDPAYGEYHTWDLLLHSPKNDKSYGKREMITQWADMVGFLHEPVFVVEAKDGQTLRQGISQGQGRMLAVDRGPGYVAGNRYGLTGALNIPPVNGWNVVAHAIYASTNSGVDLFNREVK